MVRAQIRRYRARVAGELHRSVSEEYSPAEIAGSFSLGVFITMLPTLGVGLLVFVVLAYLFDWINKIALFASVIVFNPVVKWGVYAGSMALGVLLLGSVDRPVPGELSPDMGQAIVLRLLVGNLILAAVATAIAYAVVYRFACRYQEAVQEVVDVVIEGVIDDHPSDDEG